MEGNPGGSCSSADKEQKCKLGPALSAGQNPPPWAASSDSQVGWDPQTLVSQSLTSKGGAWSR